MTEAMKALSVVIAAYLVGAIPFGFLVARLRGVDIFPVYLRFRGGKGVATGAGVVVVLVPVAASASLVTWVAVVFLTRYVSLASLAAALALVSMRLTSPGAFSSERATLTWFCII